MENISNIKMLQIRQYLVTNIKKLIFKIKNIKK